MGWAEQFQKPLIVVVKNTKRSHMLDLQPGA
jgi:hypothetical protein